VASFEFQLDGLRNVGVPLSLGAKGESIPRIATGCTRSDWLIGAEHSWQRLANEGETFQLPNAKLFDQARRMG